MPDGGAGDVAVHALGNALTSIMATQQSAERAYHEENEKLKHEMQVQFVSTTQELKGEVEVVHRQNDEVLQKLTGFQDTVGRVTVSFEVASGELAGISAGVVEQQKRMHESLEHHSAQLQSTLDGQELLRQSTLDGQEAIRQTFETAIAGQTQSFEAAMEAQGVRFDACLAENTHKLDELQVSIEQLGSVQGEISAAAFAASERIEELLQKILDASELISQNAVSILAAEERIKLNAAAQVGANLKLLGMIQLVTGSGSAVLQATPAPQQQQQQVPFPGHDALDTEEY